ncbi:MAG: hypothetical protein R2685_10935 [Candidatus Nitrosocosmicus sp.]|nr:hypothetical protein [Candidatus Nitrosocosmicus sp.]
MKYITLTLILIAIMGLSFNIAHATIPNFKDLFNTDYTYQRGCFKDTPDVCLPYAEVTYQSNSSMILKVVQGTDMAGVGLILDTVRGLGGYTIQSVVADNEPDSSVKQWIYLSR